MDKNIFLPQTEQDSLRKVFDEKKISSVTDFLSDAVEKLEEGKDWAESLVAAAPWMKEAASEFGKALPVVGAIAKVVAKWLEPNFNELAAIACTMAYQAAVRDALTGEKSFSVDQYRAKQKIDGKVRRQIRNASPAVQADLSTFTLEDANNHIFVRRADRALEIALGSIGYDATQKAKIFNQVHDGFVEKLKSLLYDSKTAEKFEPLKSFFELGNDEKRAHIALATHAEYQREQYESAPVFRFEPFALKDVYVETECGVLDWQEIRDQALKPERNEDQTHDPNFDPFDEQYGKRHNLVKKVMDFIRDETFTEPIVLQGAAGAGKSSFTIRLSAELLKEGFCPIRVRLKKLKLGKPLLEALADDAIEFGDNSPISAPRDLLLGGRIFDEFYGTTKLCRYVLILDGWDELSLSDNRGFRENVQDMLKDVRETFFRRSDAKPRVRVIITGRPSEDVIKKNDTKDGYSYFLTAQTKVLTLRPMLPDQLRDLVKRMKTALETQPIHSETAATWQIPDLAHFEQIFQAYEQSFADNNRFDEFDEFDVDEVTQPEEEAAESEPVTLLPNQQDDGDDEPLEDEEAIESPATDFDEVPVFIGNSESLDVLGSPLLAYLAIRVMAQAEGDLTELINQPTRLYRELTDQTCGGAGKFVEDKRDKPGESNDWWRTDKAKLRQLLQRTAAAMTITGQEYISKEQLLRRVFNGENDEADNIVDEAGGESALSKLMISFFFKGGHPELGCEFSHKSFREYLTAERIVEVLKEFGRASDGFDFRRRPKPERDFPANDDPRYDFSRRLSELLAPQWLKKEVVNHLEEMLRWEIQRSRCGTGSVSDLSLTTGASAETQVAHAPRTASPSATTFRQWEQIRNGLADLWEWWVDGAHLRPQWGVTGSGRSKQTTIEQPYVQELIEWSAPLDKARQDTSLTFESATTMDAHLGDGLFRLCAWVHFFVAEADGWLDEREEGIPPTLEQLWEGVSARKVFFWGTGEEVIIGEGNSPHPFQASITQGEKQWRLFAPSGENDDSFFSSIARVNSAGRNLSNYLANNCFGKAVDLRGATLNGTSFNDAFLNFASLNGAYLDCASLNSACLDRTDIDGANLDRADLYGASLDGASLDGASLDGASLDGARLYGASLDGASLDGAILDRADLRKAINLKQEQIASAWIDEDTLLPEGFEELKAQMLERRRQQMERRRQQMERQRQRMEKIKLGDEDGEEVEAETDESLD